MPNWGCSEHLLSDDRSQVSSELSRTIYKLLGTLELSTSFYHPQTNGSVEHLNHTLAQMLSMPVDESQDDWDLHYLPHVLGTYNNSVHHDNSLAPDEVRLGRMPRLRLMIFGSDNTGGHQSLPRDRLDYHRLLRQR